MKTFRNVTPKLRLLVFIRDKFTCKYCTITTETDGIKLVIDHIKPHSKGGETILDKLITACWECNIGKSNMVI